ncbi:sodium:proton antiporter [Pedobacter psychrophilus]|uniref:Na(+)/H(+) antiporter NhaA n=1 Tax=Pedobacter psychrophilus TaxID=1826909 RepID=A0A179DFQ6_9SPHI|nr:Na+/H+ antiporter NhaA [Pedobacter psychrophilus]OAQ39886.1 sodium:proton antiporter [Pedobacter psychrophilus]
MAKIINLKPYKDFFTSQSTGGILLMICVVISLIIANSSIGDAYNNLLAQQIGFETSSVNLRYSILLWINDGLMAIFFLMVGLEIKRELIEGELSSIKQASLPIMAAIGGMLVPAVLYMLLDSSEETGHGWGIPMATDIAFAIAILSLLGSKVPNSLKIFLTALAIVDDLGAILVIAIFYSTEIHFMYLLYSGGVLILLIALNYFGVKRLVFYIIPGILMWYFIHHSGIHATIAGVLTALTIPTNETNKASPLEKLEHILVKPVNFIIMPLFAIANTNIRFESEMLNNITSGLSVAIIGGLLIGKPLGILSFSWLSVKLKISKLPETATWSQIGGLGLLGGIGFTMSIFIALLSLNNPEYQTQAKFSILIASVSAGILGYSVLKFLGKSKKRMILKDNTL